MAYISTCVLCQVLQTQLQAATVATQIQQQQQTQQQLQGVSMSQPLLSSVDPKTPSSASLHVPLVAEEVSAQLPHQRQAMQQQDQQQQQAVTSLLTAQLASALGIDPTNPNTSQIALAGKVCVHLVLQANPSCIYPC